MTNINSLVINPWVPSQIPNSLGDLNLETHSWVSEPLQSIWSILGIKTLHNFNSRIQGFNA